jgi:hypothetical protein
MTYAKRKHRSRKLNVLMLVAFLSLGFLSACSDLQTQVVANKQTQSEAVARTYGSLDAVQAGKGSIWSIDRRER